THGLGYFRRHLLGSVTAKVLHDLRCPFWTSVHAEVAPELGNIHCRRILCAVDLGENSRSVLDWAAWLAREFDAKLGIVPPAAALGASVEAWSIGDEFQRAVLERAERDVAKLQTQAGTAAEVFISVGTPAII